MSKKKVAVGIVCAAVVAFAGTMGAAALRAEQKKDVPGEGQRYVYAFVGKIEGNEVTYTELEESVVTAYMQEQETGSSEREEENVSSGAPQGTEMAGPGEERSGTGMAGSGEERSGTGMPGSGEERSGTGMPKMAQKGGSSEEVSGRGGADSQEKGAHIGGSGSTQSVTTLIPVGIAVHTDADTETTFNRLASGDLLKMLVEENENGEEVIVEIWMLL